MGVTSENRTPRRRSVSSNHPRTHLSLNKDAPLSRAAQTVGLYGEDRTAFLRSGTPARGKRAPPPLSSKCGSICCGDHCRRSLILSASRTDGKPACKVWGAAPDPRIAEKCWAGNPLLGARGGEVCRSIDLDQLCDVRMNSAQLRLAIDFSQ
jgi:hypothetical protein